MVFFLVFCAARDSGGKGRRQHTGPRPDAGYTRPRAHRNSTRWKLRDGAARLTEAALGLRPRVGTAGGGRGVEDLPGHPGFPLYIFYIDR